MDDSISLSFLLQDIIHPLKEKYAIYKPAEKKNPTPQAHSAQTHGLVHIPLQLEYKKNPNNLILR